MLNDIARIMDEYTFESDLDWTQLQTIENLQLLLKQPNQQQQQQQQQNYAKY